MGIVHKQLGPGLPETVYEECLCFELADTGLPLQRRLAIAVSYRGKELEAGFRVEIESTESIQRVHEARLLTYLRLSGKKIGLLMNFNVLRLKDGLRRFVM